LSERYRQERGAGTGPADTYDPKLPSRLSEKPPDAS
jgi:hypothetical protein